MKMENLLIVNNFFSNIVKNFKFPEYGNLNSNSENVKDPVFKAISKYKKHPSIIAIKEKSRSSTFYCHEIVNCLIKQMKRLNKNKASQIRIYLSQFFTKTLILL